MIFCIRRIVWELFLGKANIKAMVVRKFEDGKEKAKEEVQKGTAVFLISDMWTCTIYLAVTYHFTDSTEQFATVLLREGKSPTLHRAANIAARKVSLI